MAYYKNTLDKVGVKMEIESAGKYKDAGDMLSRTNSTPESREVINSILDGVYAGVIAAVAEGRKMEPEQVRALIDQGPFLAGKAKAARLIDETYYEDQFLGDLTRKLGQKELKKASLRAYASAVNDAAGGAPVALIAGVGSIGRGGSGGMNEDSAILSEDFVKLLRQAADDDSLKGAIVRIDSPGGDAVASDDILREMKLLSKKKPLVISMSDVAASGGYYVAATGDPIIAYPNTITGSIGVVYGKPNVAGLYDKLGISREFYQRGKNAALDSIDGPMTPEARAKLREGIDSVYEGFVQRVAEARRTTPDKIRPVAEGRAWLGSQAKDAGLVDRLGGMDSAIAALRERAELGTDEKIKLIPYPPRRNLLTKLFSQPTEVALEAQLARVQREFGVKLPHLSVLQGGYLRLMPFSIDLR